MASVPDREGELIVYKASELGACDTYLIGSRLGFEPPPAWGLENKVFKRGHETEAKVIEWMKAQGWEITSQQTECYLPISHTEDGESIVVQCHPDAIGKSDGEYCIEIKSTKKVTYDEFKQNGWDSTEGLFPRYAWQVSCYMHANKLPLAFVLRDVDTIPDRTLVWRGALDEAPHSLEEIRARVLDLEERASNYDIPKCEKPDFFCPLSYLHEQKIEFVEDDDLDTLVREYVKWNDKVKKPRDKYAETMRLNLRGKILTKVGAGNDKTAQATGWGPAKSDGKSMRVDTPNAMVSVIWGPTRYPGTDWDKLSTGVKCPNCHGPVPLKMTDWSKDVGYGYRLRVKLRGEQGASTPDE